MAEIAVRIFLTAEDAGLGKNGNYSDSSGRTYSWDTYVPNNSLPVVGDIVIVRSKSHAVGVSMIASIASEPSYKTRMRCSVCSSTKLRWSKSLCAFRCECKEVSEVPTVEYLGDVVSFQANYEWFFTALPKISVEDIRRVAEKPLSIQSIQTAKTSEALRILPKLALWRLGFLNVNGSHFRRDLVSLGHVASDMPTCEDKCDITGIVAPGQIVTMKAITYSVAEGRFLLNVDMNVLSAVANCIQSGTCSFEEGTNELIVEFATPNGLTEFVYPTKLATSEAKNWLRNYQGLGNY